MHGVVQVNTVLGDDLLVPIGWVAVGDPARVLPPSQHEEIWEIQRALDFPGTVFGLPREAPGLAGKAARHYAELFGQHRTDRRQAAR